MRSTPGPFIKTTMDPLMLRLIVQRCIRANKCGCGSLCGALAPVLLLGLCAGVVVQSTPAAAERLAKEACEALKVEVGGLVGSGVKSDMEKGPEWAKTNLNPERMQQIARLIELEEQLAFRCRTITPVPGKRKPAGTAAKPAAPVATHAAVPEDSGPVTKPGVALETEAAAPKPKTAGAASGVKPAPTLSGSGAAAPAKAETIKPAVVKVKPPSGAQGATAAQTVQKKPKVKKSPPESTGLFSFD